MPKSSGTTGAGFSTVVGPAATGAGSTKEPEPEPELQAPMTNDTPARRTNGAPSRRSMGTMLSRPDQFRNVSGSGQPDGSPPQQDRRYTRRRAKAVSLARTLRRPDRE